MTVFRRLGRPPLPGPSEIATTASATPRSPVTVSFLGVSTVLFDDGESAILTDGFFSRPSLAKTLVLPLRSDMQRIDAALRRAGITSLDAVLCAHSHFDHALDSAAVARMTGAVLVGGSSTGFIGRGSDLPDDRIVVVENGRTTEHGNFAVTFVESAHSHPDRAHGEIERPLSQPARAREYRCGEAWSMLMNHMPSGRTALVHSSAGFRVGMLDGSHADVAYLSIGQLGRQSRAFIEQYWRETVSAVGARRVVLTHWDNFFRPVHKPLHALPYAFDDMPASIAVLNDCARRDGIVLELPTLWRRGDPWARGTRQSV
ncbi:MBL fold metallo-hydrolase [Rhodococcus sp. Leaf278]|uniref:MBL fold metallo-hydrolase n=1 Tax=Rhodococcus sp. Leaf278 TaxID=1736319 RepID=UPI000AA4DE22|nr:MBL fold metallo-hydrolase [Rhodococcus sp. Leaf278]